MRPLIIVANSYFDGVRLHDCGPYTLEVRKGVIARIYAGDITGRFRSREWTVSAHEPQVLSCDFLMPGLVEAHCHVFLDGGELDKDIRKSYLSATPAEMYEVGLRSVGQNLSAGITLIRDAGDFHGINHRVRAHVNAGGGAAPHVRSPGRALRKAGRYGGFMAVEVKDAGDIRKAIEAIAPEADDLKILMTGIIDFEKGQMKGGVQFDLAETTLMVEMARDLGLRTFAHCSGNEGLGIAVQAGIDSIEHGFFMDREILCAMADRGTAWVPTFAPVEFQRSQPHLAGWNPQTVDRLGQILDHHAEHVAMAADTGVAIVAGSDAGSYGVPHGTGLLDEMLMMHEAGMPMDKVLAAATSVPRELWACPSANIVPGNRADLILLASSPFGDPTSLRSTQAVVMGEAVHEVSPAASRVA